MKVPPLGSGLVYQPELEPLLEREPWLVSVLELEPETFWQRTDDPARPYAVRHDVLETLASLGRPWLLHSVAFPLGGTSPPDAAALAPLREVVDALRPAWISAHLSFNSVPGPDGPRHAGFLLPPLQTGAGIRTAVDRIRRFQDAFDVPVAVETGVNYLRPRPGECDDGDYFAEIAERADCGLLVDLHNLWANERNGRQAADACLARLPPGRVWELHVAGGQELDGYWLDAHSDTAPEPVMDLADRWLPRWPCVGALVFELIPMFVERVGLAAVEAQLRRLRRLWERRSRPTSAAAHAARPGRLPRVDATWATPAEYERALVDAVTGRTQGQGAPAFGDDPGVALLRTLVERVRGGKTVEVLRFTCRLILLHGGPEALRTLLHDHWRACPPQLFAADEAEAFAAFLRRRAPSVPFLDDALAFDLARLAVLRTGREQATAFAHDPVPLLAALAEGRLPALAERGRFTVTVTDRDDLDGLVEIPLRE